MSTFEYAGDIIATAKITLGFSHIKTSLLGFHYLKQSNGLIAFTLVRLEHAFRIFRVFFTRYFDRAQHSLSFFTTGAAVTKWFDCSPLVKANRIKSPAGSVPNFFQVGIVPDDAAALKTSLLGAGRISLNSTHYERGALVTMTTDGDPPYKEIPCTPLAGLKGGRGSARPAVRSAILPRRDSGGRERKKDLRSILLATSQVLAAADALTKDAGASALILCQLLPESGGAAAVDEHFYRRACYRTGELFRSCPALIHSSQLRRSERERERVEIRRLQKVAGNSDDYQNRGDTVWHCSSESIACIQNAITPLDCQRIKGYAKLSEDCEASRAACSSKTDLLTNSQCDKRAEHLPRRKHRGANPRPSDSKSATLPLSYEGRAPPFTYNSQCIISVTKCPLTNAPRSASILCLSLRVVLVFYETHSDGACPKKNWFVRHEFELLPAWEYVQLNDYELIKAAFAVDVAIFNTSFTLPRKVAIYSAPTETAPRRVSFRPPPPEHTRDRDSHESTRATRRRRGPHTAN
ncbi:hypothetical protein PR048_033251 [Dryococelus australis]|uniref:Uncharacterized protein n=1 Tax=Dryococelus australis TaxID=614101 RepID=A0ABQ9FZS8_9NEOP|nr:hypothetical protein PR048_033251 [Dryococelus australis]